MSNHQETGVPDDDSTPRRAAGSTGDQSDGFSRADNPYYAKERYRDAPDLDAGAPSLAQEESRRVNRKALLFLAGIVLMLMFMAYALFKSATKSDEVVEAPKRENVVVPDLPQARPAAPAAPVPLAEADIPPLPQPPPVELDYRPPAQPQAPAPPSLLDRRISGIADPASIDQAGAGRLPEPDGQGTAVAGRATGSARFIARPRTLLVRGTYIRCILETRIVTDVPGFTSCNVTEPVYSINGARLLIPKGSKALGSYGRGAGDIHRVSVVWDRILTPTGVDISMSSPGIDTLGGSGIPGHYDAHWGQRLASGLLISLISDGFKYAAAENGPESTRVGVAGTIVTEPYESATARTLERVANEAISENMRRPATLAVNQGSVINIYVAQDVDFSSVVAP